MKRHLAGLVALVTLGTLAPSAATAAPFMDTSVVLFQGVAVVCMDAPAGPPKAPAAPCPPASPNGLYMPGHGPGPGVLGIRPPGVSDKWVQRTGAWAFASAPLAPPMPGCVALVPANLGVVKPCAIAAAGMLAPVGGIGAACGITHGYGGAGPMAIGASMYALSNVTWPSSAGGTIPFVGSYDFVGTADPAKDKGVENPDREGPLVGMLQVQGGSACFKFFPAADAGASTFNIVGVAAMV